MASKYYGIYRSFLFQEGVFNLLAAAGASFSLLLLEEAPSSAALRMLGSCFPMNPCIGPRTSTKLEFIESRCPLQSPIIKRFLHFAIFSGALVLRRSRLLYLLTLACQIHSIRNPKFRDSQCRLSRRAQLYRSLSALKSGLLQTSISADLTDGLHL